MEYLILGIRRGWRGLEVEAVLVKKPALFRQPDRAGKKPKGRNPSCQLSNVAPHTALKAVYLTSGGHRLGS
jgi:hypothetical protein